MSKLISILTKALKALADKGENVPLDRVTKRLETAGVRQNEIDAAGIPSLLSESPTVTTRSGNEAVTPQSILDLDANRLDAPAITNDGLIAEETALFKEQNKEVLTGSDLQAQQNRESPEWHEQRIARLQLEIDENNEYLRELELEPDSQFEMEDVALENAEFESDIEIYEEQLFELRERLANPVPDTTPAIREQTRDVPEGVSGIRGEIFTSIAPKDVNLDTYGVSIFTDARTKRNSTGVENDPELRSVHFPTFDDYSYHMRWDIEEDGNTLRIFEMQNDLSPTGEGPLINNFFGTDGNLNNLPDALLPQAEKNNLEKIFNETVKTKQKLTETILDPILKAHDFEIKLTADDLVDANTAGPLDGTERWEMSSYNEFSDTYDVREITSPPGMGREIHILEKGEDFDFIGEDITNDVLSQVKTAHEEFTSSIVKLFEETEGITRKAQETINFNFNKQFDQTYDPYQNLINRAIVKADAENLDSVKFLIGNNSPTSTEYMGISNYYSENERGLLVRSLSIQKHYESVIAGQIRRTAEKIGAKVKMDNKGYLILTLPAAGFTLPLYADEEDKESSFIATATVRGNDPEEAREYLNNRQPQSPPPLPEGRSVRGNFNTGGKVIEIIANIAASIMKNSKKPITEAAATEAAENIVKQVNVQQTDEFSDVPVLMGTDDPDYAEFLETETRVLLREKHDLSPTELEEQFGLLSDPENFSKRRGYTEEEIQDWDRSVELQDQIEIKTGFDTMDETFIIQNVLDDIQARDIDYGGEPQSPPPLPEGRSVRGDFNTGGKVLRSLGRTRRAEGGPPHRGYFKPVKELLTDNKDKEFVRRVLNPALNDALKRDKSVASNETHRMAAEVDDKTGNWFVYPTVVNKGGTLTKPANPMQAALDSGEYISFGKDKDQAVWLAADNYKIQEFKEHVKKAAP